MVMTRSVPSCLLVLLFSLASLSDVNAYPSDFLEDGDGLDQQLGSSWPFFGQLTKENDLAPRREEALQKIQEILGIRSQSENLAHRKVPPQFMVELYNTIADPSGVTRGRNPYNAKVVRSFIERDSSLSHFYFFNISGLEVSESVLEAELHLYRKKMPLKNMRPSTLTSPYYLIRVYQVLDDRSLDVPDLHRLLSVRCVGAHASGWQVFNVKQAVLGWVSGELNLGLLVTASTLFEEEVAVEFSRRNDYHHNKQPILVLFDDDNGDRNRAGITSVAPRYYAYGNQEDVEDDQQAEEIAYEKDAKGEKIDLENSYDSVEHYRRHKQQQGQPEEARVENRRDGEPEFFQRQKRRHGEEEDQSDGSPSRYDGLRQEAGTLTLEVTSGRRRRDAASSKKRSSKIVSSRDMRKTTGILTSMDIYERATFRERLGQTARDRSMRRSAARERRLTRSTTSGQDATTPEQNSTSDECARHELYVDFRDIGLSSSIIAPAGYSAYQCKGVCEPPLRQDQRPTNHATIQAIVHKMGLVKGVKRPCCVPTKLLSTSILFYDDNENVVLKMYEDMIADRCGCR